MESEITEHITEIMVQLSVVILSAKLCGELCERFIKIPPVLGELFAGILIGPYALGNMSIGSFGPLFELHTNNLNPVSVIPFELYVIAQIASIILLFTAGLETDLKQFLRYAGPATAAAVGGVVLPFSFGIIAALMFNQAESIFDPVALFLGAILTATSVGITARVLSDLGAMTSPEGVTILGAAVIDDILVILVLTIVVAISATGEISLGELGFIAFKGIGFWLLFTGLLVLLSNRISRAFTSLNVTGAALCLSLSLAIFGAALAEHFGLAMIIGAYSAGLALSGTNLKRVIWEQLEGVHDFLVPVFFVVMGMLVDISGMLSAIQFSIVMTILAIISKIAGSGIPSLFTGFNKTGAYRIGLGMLPRGEVALIVAGVGLSRGVINQEQFGVAILMTVITTVLAPILLVPSIKNGKPGTKIK